MLGRNEQVSERKQKGESACQEQTAEQEVVNELSSFSFCPKSVGKPRLHFPKNSKAEK